VKSAPVLAARFGSHMAPSSAVAEQPVLLQFDSQTIRDAYALLTLFRVRRLVSPMWKHDGSRFLLAIKRVSQVMQYIAGKRGNCQSSGPILPTITASCSHS